MPRELIFPRNVAKTLPNPTAAKYFSSNEAQLKGFFWIFDSDGDGSLSRDELKKAFKSIGSSIPGWRARRAIGFADQNGDGSVSEEELDGLVQYALKYGYSVK